MIKEYNSLRVAPHIAYQPDKLKQLLAREANVKPSDINDVIITRRSIDARQRNVMVNLAARVYIHEPAPEKPLGMEITYPDVTGKTPVIVVGAGPAGLFAALRLIELGLRPIVVERGKNVSDRRKDMARIARESVVDPDSNYCFGEGGAGAFSDGKLYTRSKKRGSVEKILSVFHNHGASSDILVDAHPHIGTDRLPEVIRAMRETIIACGGEVRFSTRMESLNIEDGKVTGITLADGSQLSGPVILATGHSARDVYRMLHRSGVLLEPKGIAVGVRLEHPQHLIDTIQYHNPEGRGKWLPAAEYSMLTRVNDRAVYSFCMCPGGFVIPAASEPGQLVVNGMSPSNRGTRWSNSGMVVEILPEDVKDLPDGSPLKMMEYQEAIERRFFADSGDETYSAPAQRMEDFTRGKKSATLPPTSYAPGIHSSRIDQLLPREIATRMQEGFRQFGRKSKGFLTNEAILLGAETRTSAPVRIPRDNETLCHIEIPGLFPTGEGAGYAGGIVSAAMDGERAADAVKNYLSQNN